MRKEDKARLERNDRAMLRWICGVKISDRVSLDSLYQRLGIAPLTTLLRSRRLRCLGMSGVVMAGLTSVATLM